MLKQEDCWRIIRFQFPTCLLNFCAKHVINIIFQCPSVSYMDTLDVNSKGSVVFRYYWISCRLRSPYCSDFSDLLLVWNFIFLYIFYIYMENNLKPPGYVKLVFLVVVMNFGTSHSTEHDLGVVE